MLSTFYTNMGYWQLGIFEKDGKRPHLSLRSSVSDHPYAAESLNRDQRLRRTMDVLCSSTKWKLFQVHIDDNSKYSQYEEQHIIHGLNKIIYLKKKNKYH